MTDFPIQRRELDEDKPWGKAHPQRGAGYTDKALAFLAAFPIGSTLSPEEFDAWAHRHSFLQTTPEKESDAWPKHVRDRNVLRRCISRASTHPRMGDRTFTIAVVASGSLWVVRSLQEAIVNNNAMDQIAGLYNTKLQQLAYILQGADWSAQLPHERPLAEAIYDDLEVAKAIQLTQAKGFMKKIQKIKDKLRQSPQPQDDRLRQILQEPEEVDEADDVSEES